MSILTTITNTKQTDFILDTPGRHIFFLHNISGDFTFSLDAPQAEASIFALFTGTDHNAFTVNIRQLHHAPDTVSNVVVKFLGKDRSSLDYRGLICIEKEASGAKASQSNANLLLSDHSKAFAFPSLEILTDDVTCRHGSTTARVNQSHLFYAQTRGIDLNKAEAMLGDGFVQSFFNEIEKLGSFQEITTLKNTL